MAFDPNQPRDYHGRWTDTGAEGEAHTTVMQRWGKNIGNAVRGAASDMLKMILQKAKEAAPELQDEAKKVADAVGGTLVPINLKSGERILEKANNKYGGDLNKVTDTVRTTIMTTYDKLETAAAKLNALPGIVRVKIQDGEEYFGYKGILANWKASNGVVAEIQVNAPGMLYAKEASKDNMGLLTPAQKEEIFKRTGIPCCKGHEYYEQIRTVTHDLPIPLWTTEMHKAVDGIIAKSKEYYSHFYGF